MIIINTKSGAIEELLENDELINEMGNARVFVGFQEMRIDFLPTFKVIIFFSSSL